MLLPNPLPKAAESPIEDTLLPVHEWSRGIRDIEWKLSMHYSLLEEHYLSVPACRVSPENVRFRTEERGTGVHREYLTHGKARSSWIEEQRFVMIRIFHARH